MGPPGNNGREGGGGGGLTTTMRGVNSVSSLPASPLLPSPPPPTLSSLSSKMRRRNRHRYVPYVKSRDRENGSISSSVLNNVGELMTVPGCKFYTFQKNGKVHNLVKMPSEIPNELMVPESSRPLGDIYNIVMVDVSCSMRRYWPSLLEGWNAHVAPTLLGLADLYVFSDNVVLRRSRMPLLLESGDFLGGESNLSNALRVTLDKINSCAATYVKVFMITAGSHESLDLCPQMQTPSGKTCEVYITGVGDKFSVKCAINIRSLLHSGTSEIPYLFWSNSQPDTIKQMERIAYHNVKNNKRGGMGLQISMSGSTLPGVKKKNVFFPSEFVYTTSSVEEKMNELFLTFRYGTKEGHITLQEEAMCPFTYVDEVLPQWNSFIIQTHVRGEKTPQYAEDLEQILEEIQSLFFTLRDEMAEKTAVTRTIKHRLQKNILPTYESKFRRMRRELTTVLLSDEGSSTGERLQLIRSVLNSTSSPTSVGIKGKRNGGDDDDDKKHRNDCDQFAKVYAENKEVLLHLPCENNENLLLCCCVNQTSTITDLIDPNFPNLLKLNKISFLKNFSVTGVPVLGSMRERSNPWSFKVKSCVNPKYPILSQLVLEDCPNVIRKEGCDNVVMLNEDEEDVCFNSIVPLFSSKYARLMSPFVRTRLYSTCATFSILRETTTLPARTYEVHLAALGSLWVYLLYGYLSAEERERIEDIESTAALYIQQWPDVNRYGEMMWENPTVFLMREEERLGCSGTSRMKHQQELKCDEMFAKCMFLLYMWRWWGDGVKVHIGSERLKRVIRAMLVHYVNFCFRRMRTPIPFTRLFASELEDPRKRKEWVQNTTFAQRSATINDGLEETITLETYYTLEEVKKKTKMMARNYIRSIRDKLVEEIPLELSTEGFESLSSSDLSLYTLRVFAERMGLSGVDTADLFSGRSMLVYVTQSRRKTPVANSYEDCETFIRKRIYGENAAKIFGDVYDQQYQHLVDSWLKAYADAHRELVQPMTQRDVVIEASKRGFGVTNSTFHEFYQEYRPYTGLLSNACQCRACPHFLKPHTNYNQHAKVERENVLEPFVHALHLTTRRFCESEVDVIAERIIQGTESYVTRGKTRGLGLPLASDILTVLESLREDISKLKVSYQNSENEQGEEVVTD